MAAAEVESSSSLHHNNNTNYNNSSCNNNNEDEVKSPFDEFLSALPTEVFEMSSTKAISKLILSILVVMTGVFLVKISPSFMLPLSWLLLGTAMTGLFAVGLSCGQNLFFTNKYINYLVGTLCMLFLMYPFEYWKTARRSLSSVKNFSYRVANSPFWFLSSVVQWVSSHATFEVNRRMIASATILYLSAATVFPLLAHGVGTWGLFKYYFIPLLVFHFWMSTFLKANLISLLNDSPVLWRFPFWVQFLSNDCNYGMIFSNFSSKFLPTYKWKDAYQAAHRQFGQNLPELSFGYLLLPKSISKSKWAKKQVVNVVASAAAVANGSIPSMFENINWPTSIFMFATPLIALYGVLTCPFDYRTYLLAFATYAIALMGITAGYHRLFSHRSYDANIVVNIFLTICGTSAFEMSVIEWCKDHRYHHRYTDTDKDPYNIKKGFWWAHMGWLLYKRELPPTDVSDLEAQWHLRFQHKYFLPLAFSLGFGAPMLVAGYFWGDWKGGLLIGGVLSKVIALQCTFCINSLAHWLGEATYSDQRTPRDSWICALVTFGEGYHNFHHEFPYDYRNGIKWSAYDPGKWFICFLSYFGLTYNLKRFPAHLFEKGEITMADKKLAARRAKLFWGKPVEELPVITREEVELIGNKPGEELMIIEDIVYDISQFAPSHPGGKKIMLAYFGKDATNAFNGAVYNHSYAARHLLDTFRVAKISE